MSVSGRLVDNWQMRQVTVDPAGYEALAEHLPRGRSLRQIARELGRSHEAVRHQIAREGADLVSAVERHMRQARRPLFELGPQEDLADWQRALSLVQYVVDQLRARGWAVCARGVRIRGADEATVAIEIVFVEQEEQ